MAVIISHSRTGQEGGTNTDIGKDQVRNPNEVLLPDNSCRNFIMYSCVQHGVTDTMQPYRILQPLMSGLPSCFVPMS